MISDRFLVAVVCVLLSMLTQFGCSEPISSPSPANSASQSDSNKQDTPAPSSPMVQPKPDAMSPESMKLLQASRRNLHTGQYTDALSAARQLVKLQPDKGSYQLLLGETAFMAGEITQSIKAFDELIRIDPQVKPQLWQRGLALYYAGEFEQGVEQFEIHQTVNSQDVENAVWHMLCSARLTGIDQARKQLIPIHQDSRIPMKEVFELFSGELSPEDVLAAAENAPGQKETEKKVSLFYAHLYNGLFYEMIGDDEKSAISMAQAETINPSPKSNLMGRVAAVHLKVRGRDAEPGNKHQQ